MQGISLTQFITFQRRIPALIFSLCISLLGLNFDAHAEGPKPAAEMSSLFKQNMYPNGTLHIQELDLVFVPEGSDVQVVVKTETGNVVQTFNTLPGFSLSNEVFSRVNMEGYTQADLVPGKYVLDVMINEAVATRLNFTVVGEVSGDAFTTSKKVHFQGSWQQLGFLRFTKSLNFTQNTEYQLLNARIWGGLDDLSPDSNGEQFTATLTRDQKVFGHSKVTSGFLSSNKEINPVDFVIFKPHTREMEANVLGVSQADLVAGDHDYRLTVTRQKDGEIIRNFEFRSRDGMLVPLPRSEFGYTPQHAYLAPRALVHGTSRYEFEPVYWLEMK